MRMFQGIDWLLREQYDYPTDYENLIEDSSESSCADAIQAALESWN